MWGKFGAGRGVWGKFGAGLWRDNGWLGRIRGWLGVFVVVWGRFDGAIGLVVAQ